MTKENKILTENQSSINGETNKNQLYLATGSPDYIPVLFQESNAAVALATARKMNAALYLRNEDTGRWEPLYLPYGGDLLNKCLFASCGLDWERCQYAPGKRLDCMFLKSTDYYYMGAGIIAIPQRVVISRCSCLDGKELPACPLCEYDVFSEETISEI